MATKTEDKTLGEWLAYECDQNYCRENVTFINNSGAVATHKTGQVLEFFTPNYGPIATEANSIGIMISNPGELANNGTARVVMLARGPALVVKEKLGISGQTLADIMTALAALDPPILPKPIVDATDKSGLVA